MNERLDRQVNTPSGLHYTCEIHGRAGLRPCPECKFGGSVGSKVKITECRYECVIDGIDRHGGSLGHIGEITWIGYLQEAGCGGATIADDLIGCSVRCPKTNIMGHEIWALEVADLTAEEYDAVWPAKNERGQK